MNKKVIYLYKFLYSSSLLSSPAQSFIYDKIAGKSFEKHHEIKNLLSNYDFFRENLKEILFHKFFFTQTEDDGWASKVFSRVGNEH